MWHHNITFSSFAGNFEGSGLVGSWYNWVRSNRVWIMLCWRRYTRRSTATLVALFLADDRGPAFVELPGAVSWVGWDAGGGVVLVGGGVLVPADGVGLVEVDVVVEVEGPVLAVDAVGVLVVPASEVVVVLILYGFYLYESKTKLMCKQSISRTPN